LQKITREKSTYITSSTSPIQLAEIIFQLAYFYMQR